MLSGLLRLRKLVWPRRPLANTSGFLHHCRSMFIIYKTSYQYCTNAEKLRQKTKFGVQFEFSTLLTVSRSRTVYCTWTFEVMLRSVSPSPCWLLSISQIVSNMRTVTLPLSLIKDFRLWYLFTVMTVHNANLLMFRSV